MLIFDLDLTKLRIFDTRNKKLWNVVLPKGLIEHVEVADPAKYGQWWAEILKQIPTREKEAILLFNEGLCFDKEIDNPKAADDFWPEVPLGEREMSTKVIRLPGKLVAIAIDKRIYEVATEVFNKNRFKVWATAAGFALAVTKPEGGWGWKELKTIESLTRLKLVNNWMEKKTEIKKERPVQTSNKKHISWLVISELLIIPVLILWLGVAMKGNAKKKTPTVTPTPAVSSVQPTLVPTPTIEPVTEVDVATIKVLVLNASGKTGEAARMKDYLTKKGYQNIDTGNAAETELEGLTIRTGAKQTHLGKRVKDDLKEGYSLVDIQLEEAENSEYEVVVLIGQE